MPGRIGSELRIRYYRARGARIGADVRIDPGVSIDNPDQVVIGSNTWIDRFVVIIAGAPRPGRETKISGAPRPDLIGRVIIGENCHIAAHAILSGIGGLEIGNEVTVGAGSHVYSLSHHYRSWDDPSDRGIAFTSQVPTDRQSMLQGPVVLEDNVGLGANTLVLPGTTIGRDSFVRPLSVVSGAWPSNSLLAGNPASRTGQRYASPASA